MSRVFRIRLKAEKDIRAAYLWYEEQETGLGIEFLAVLRERLEAIQRFPESSPILYRNVRRAVVPRFPYVVFYVTDERRLSVLAVLHQFRDPATWPSRGIRAH